jgi:putative transposase
LARPTGDIRGASIFGRDNVVIFGRAGFHLLSWRKFLSVDASESEMTLFRKHERTGRPIGDKAFIERLERLLDRRLKPRKPGQKPRDK